jgi:hypothetical protein
VRTSKQHTQIQGCKYKKPVSPFLLAGRWLPCKYRAEVGSVEAKDANKKLIGADNYMQ